MFESFDSHEWQTRYDKLYGYFYRRVNSRSDVEDLTMETLEKFYLSEKKIENPNAFIWGIARNKMLEYIRYKGKNQFQELVDWAEIENNQNSSIELQDNWLENYRSSEYQAKLERLKECAKNQLSELDQEIVNLCVSQDFKSANVAQKLSISPENTRQRLSRALKKLREKCREAWVSNDLGSMSS
jgi:RNA polymerase sigma factor (sigma-70 family)